MKHEMDLLNAAMGMIGTPAMKEPSFPKYDIYQLLDGNPYIYFLEFALAGFDKSSISAEMDNGYLVLSGKSSEVAKSEREYLRKGIARRDFSTRIYLGKDVEVRSANFADGMLTIEVERMIPEEKKPRSIEIS